MHTLLVHPSDVARIAQCLCESGLAVFPTDTVYGIATLAQDEKAVGRLFAAKGRDFRAALPVMVAALDNLTSVALPLPGLDTLAERFWPGPLTIVLPKTPSLPPLVTGGGNTVGVRIPDHPFVLELLRTVGLPLAVTSANLSGQPPAMTALEALAQLDGRVHLIVDGGRAPGGVPSTVIDLTTRPPRVLRAGPIPAADLSAALGQQVAGPA